MMGPRTVRDRNKGEVESNLLIPLLGFDPQGEKEVHKEKARFGKEILPRKKHVIPKSANATQNRKKIVDEITVPRRTGY